MHVLVNTIKDGIIEIETKIMCWKCWWIFGAFEAVMEYNYTQKENQNRFFTHELLTQRKHSYNENPNIIFKK